MLKIYYATDEQKSFGSVSELRDSDADEATEEAADERVCHSEGRHADADKGTDTCGEFAPPHAYIASARSTSPWSSSGSRATMAM